MSALYLFNVIRSNSNIRLKIKLEIVSTSYKLKM